MIYLAFYAGKGSFHNRLIRMWTRSQFSHVEIFDVSSDRIRMYSSSAMDGGVRVKMIEKSELKAGNWFLVEIDSIVTRDITAFTQTNETAKYDYFGVFFSQFIKLGWHSKRRYFCSEFCAEILGFKSPQKFSPQQLFDAIKQA